MANETTQAIHSNAAGLQIAEVLGSSLIPVGKPKLTQMVLSNHDSIAGASTETKRYGKEADEGPGVAATENVGITTNTQLDAGTAADVAVGENSVRRIEVTDRAIERRTGVRLGNGGIAGLFQRADPAEMLAALGPFKKALVEDIWEKVEADIVGLNSTLTTTAGSGAAEFGVADFIDGQYKLGVAEAVGGEVTVATLTQRMLKNIRLELGVTSGGFGGGAWSNPQTNVGILNFKGIHGYVDNLLGTEVFGVSESVKDVSGSDEVGAMFVPGMQTAPDDPGNDMQSPFLYLEGRDDITYYAQLDAGGRKMILVAVLVFGSALTNQPQGCGLLGDNS